MSFRYPGWGSGNTAGRLYSVLHPFSVLSPRLFYLYSVSTFRDFPSMAYRQVREYPLDVETIKFLLCTGCFEISQISNIASKLLRIYYVALIFKTSFYRTWQHFQHWSIYVYTKFCAWFKMWRIFTFLEKNINSHKN